MGEVLMPSWKGKLYDVMLKFYRINLLAQFLKTQTIQNESDLFSKHTVIIISGCIDQTSIYESWKAALHV